MAYTLERRSPRKRFEHLLYVELEPGNGGMVLNFSEHGFAFRAMRRVRPKQEVKFAFNLTDKRRLEGRGRLEWADQEGRVAGMQFTDISEEFRAELQNWLAISPEVIPSNLGPQTVNPAEATGGPSPTPPKSFPQRVAADPALVDARRREAVLRIAGAKANRAVAPSESADSDEFAEPSEYAEPTTPPPDSLAYENPRPDPAAELPWAATLPPAIGVERKPAAKLPKASAQLSELSSLKAVEQPLYSPPVEAEPPQSPSSTKSATVPTRSREKSEAAAPPSATPAATSSVDAASIAAIEAQTASALNDHAQTLLQHFQQEEQRMMTAFRDSTGRLIRESERKLFPIREAAQAQIKSLESSVSSAAASAKVLDQYPALLERAQQQALDRYQAQMQEILHGHVMEMRRRSDMALEEINARAAAVMPRRIGTTSGILVTVLMIALLAALFMYRREVADGFIWVGQRIADSSATNEPAKTEPAPEVKTGPGKAAAAPEPKPVPAKPSPARTSEEPATSTAAPPVAEPKESAAPAAAPANTPVRDVKSLWADVARGDVNAEMALGTMYFTGHGVTKNCYQARRLFTAAAKKGNAEARQKLAQLDNGACG
jgi:hypothetical protein